VSAPPSFRVFEPQRDTCKQEAAAEAPVNAQQARTERDVQEQRLGGALVVAFEQPPGEVEAPRAGRPILERFAATIGEALRLGGTRDARCRSRL
jgi:hypothetical protein